jgi:hypothetical protein
VLVPLRVLSVHQVSNSSVFTFGVAGVEFVTFSFLGASAAEFVIFALLGASGVEFINLCIFGASCAEFVNFCICACILHYGGSTRGLHGNYLSRNELYK